MVTNMRSTYEEEPKSWLGRKARALKEKFKGKDSTKAKGPGIVSKARDFYESEIKGGLQEAKEELGLDEALAASGRKRKVVRAKLKKVQAAAAKATKGYGGRSGVPAFMQGMSSPGPQTELISARSVANPGGPHFMGAIVHGSGPPGRGRGRSSPPQGWGVRNPAEAMGWGSPGSRGTSKGGEAPFPWMRATQEPKKKRGMTPGQVTIIIGGRAPKAQGKKKASRSRPGAPRGGRGFMPGIKW